jgi:hypothetical protein
MPDPCETTPDANTDPADDTVVPKSRLALIRGNWKKAAIGLIALDLTVALAVTVFGGSERIQSMVFEIFR